MKISRDELAGKMDYSVDRSDLTGGEVRKYCEIAKNYKFGVITVLSRYVALAKRYLHGSDVRVGAPLLKDIPSDILEHTRRTKVKDYIQLARQAIESGADHLEFWINVAAVKDGEYERAKRELENTIKEIRAIRKDIVIIVILETGYFLDEEIVKLAKMIKEAGADVLKTGSGFGPIGVTTHDVKLIRKAVGPYMHVKAAGITRFTGQALALLRAGADRLSVSRGPQLVDGLQGV